MKMHSVNSNSAKQLGDTENCFQVNGELAVVVLTRNPAERRAMFAYVTRAGFVGADANYMMDISVAQNKHD